MGTGKTCAYCMFPFYTISQGRCGRFPDVVSIIYPASIGQYWSRLRALLPYWQQDNRASNNNGSEKDGAAERCCTGRLCLHS